MDTIERIAEMLENENENENKESENEDILKARLDALEQSIARLVENVNSLTNKLNEINIEKESVDNGC